MITGNETVFAAGADIKRMLDRTYPQNVAENFLGTAMIKLGAVSKPVIAAVNGVALGGGCEVALLCDICYAGENALFGQSEIIIGTLPGGGATQRLPKVLL